MKEKDKTDFHIFETNHPYFIEIGLGMFTTGTLLEWWNERDNLGRYLNRRHINVPASPDDKLDFPSNTLQTLLGITDTTEFSWYGWKPNQEIENAGRFAKQNLKGLNDNNGGEDSQIWSHAGQTTAGIGDVQSTVESLELATKNPVIGVSLSGQGDGYAGVPVFATAEDPFDGSFGHGDFFGPLRKIKPLYSLIQLNKFMNHYDDYFPRETWSVTDDTTHEGLEKKGAFGRVRGGGACTRHFEAGFLGPPNYQFSKTTPHHSPQTTAHRPQD